MSDPGEVRKPIVIDVHTACFEAGPEEACDPCRTVMLTALDAVLGARGEQGATTEVL